MVDSKRLHANGRHFALMRAVCRSEAVTGRPSKEMADLIRWGYVEHDGAEYTATDEGLRANETWQNMEDR